MNEKVMVSPEIQTEAVVLPQIVSIKQASAGHGVPVRHQVVHQPWQDG